MSDEDIFAEANPFKKLAKKDVGNKKKSVPPPQKTFVAKSSENTHAKNTVDANKDDDTDVFLDAMRHVSMKKVSKKQGRYDESIANPLPLAKNDLQAIQNTPKEFAPNPSPQEIPTPSTALHPSTPKNTAKAEQNTEPEQDEGMTFMEAMNEVAPLHTKGRDVPTTAIPPQMPPPPIEPNPLDEVMASDIEFALASTREYVEGHVVGLDLMLLTKLQAGQFRPEAHIDLHGLDIEQAYLALADFFKMAYYKNHRIVLVVPGRGLNSPAGIAVLREKVQAWLTQDPLKRIVLAFCSAKPMDGGAGALYVLLRKHKKSKGKIVWQRTPIDMDIFL